MDVKDLQLIQNDSTLSKHFQQRVDVVNRESLSFSGPGKAEGFSQANANDDEGLSIIYASFQVLAELHRTHSNMDSLLQTASRIVVEILGIEHCSIGLLDKADMVIRVRTSHTREGKHANVQRILRVFADLVDSQRLKYSYVVGAQSRLGANPDLLLLKELISPLRIEKQIVGYVCGLKDEGFNAEILDSERAVFFSLSQQISYAIEAQQTREMLNCPHIALALSANERASLVGLGAMERPSLEPIANPEKLVRKVARRFFADLRKAGFETDQILRIATEILDNLLHVLQKTKARRQG